MIDTAQLKADTVSILSDWAETLTIKRATQADTNGTGETVPSWSTIATVTGDWQDGRSNRFQPARTGSGLDFEFEALAVLPFGTNVVENDQIHRSDGSYDYVIFVENNEDHVVAFLRKNK